MAYRTSFGDQTVPDYSYWLTTRDDKVDNQHFEKRFMMSAIYFTWFTNQILCILFLIGFLIATISQMYSLVSGNRQRYTYE